MKYFVIAIIVFLLFFTTSYSQKTNKQSFVEIYSSLDSADAVFNATMGFSRANLIYENEIPKIIGFLSDSTNSRVLKTQLLNRWYKSQKYFARGLGYKYGDNIQFASLGLSFQASLQALGIECIPAFEDDRARKQPFTAHTTLFLQYANSLNDSVLVSFLKIIKNENSWQKPIVKILESEEFLTKYPDSYYSKAVFDIYVKHTSSFLSHTSLFGFDPGGTPHCEKIEWLINDNKEYLNKFPNGFVSQIVMYNLNRLQEIKPKFCETQNSDKRKQIIESLNY